MAHPFPSPPRLVLFDLDETLLDNRYAAELALRTCVDEWKEIFGDISGEEAFNRWSAINAQLWNDYGRGALNEQQLRHQRVARLLVWACDRSNACYTEQLADRFRERYFELFVGAARPLDGVVDLLAALRSEVALGVVTNGFSDIQRARLERSGVMRYVDHVVISEEVAARKPERAIFHHALALFSLDAGSALMVGDSLDYDIAGAHAAGLATVWLRPAGRDAAEGEAVATASVADVAELSQLLRTIIAIPHIA